MRRMRGLVLVAGLVLLAGSALGQAPPLPGQRPQSGSGQEKHEKRDAKAAPEPAGASAESGGGLSVEVVNRIPPVDRENLKAYWPGVEKKTKEQWMRVLDGSAKSLAGTQGDLKILGWIHTDGRATGLSVEQSSGNRALDRAAIGAITQSAPYDPFPYGIAVDEVKVRFTFDGSGAASGAPKELPK